MKWIKGTFLKKYLIPTSGDASKIGVFMRCCDQLLEGKLKNEHWEDIDRTDLLQGFPDTKDNGGNSIDIVLMKVESVLVLLASARQLRPSYSSRFALC
jgi:hypothetical protein